MSFTAKEKKRVKTYTFAYANFYEALLHVFYVTGDIAMNKTARVSFLEQLHWDEFDM